MVTKKCAILHVFAILLILSNFNCVRAQIPTAVPTSFTNLYSLMQKDLTNFEATVDSNWNGIYYTNARFPACIEVATDGGEGAAITNTNYFKYTALPYLNALQQMEVKAVKVSFNFPLLYQPYYTSTNGLNYPQGYTNMFNFVSNLVAAVRERGMYLIIPTQNVFPFLIPSINTYYESLSFSDYTNGRSTQIQTIVKNFRPDVCMMQSEPITEVDNLTTNLSNELNNPVVDTNMLMGFLGDLKEAGLRNSSTLIGAGMGTWQPSFDTYLTNFIKLPLDILDVHVYPINRITNGNVVTDFLQRTLQMADAAHSVGMKVGMGEFWSQKEYDSELADPPSQLVFEGRNTYGFWAPLDVEMELTMIKLAHYKQFEFVDPFFTEYFFASLDYTNEQPRIAGLSPDAAGTQLNEDELAASSAAVAAGNITNAGGAWMEYTPSTTPALSLFSATPASLGLTWTALASEFNLEQSTNLSLPNWLPMSVPARAVGGDYTNFILISNRQAYFRLHNP